jgi:hypothetical protein
MLVVALGILVLWAKRDQHRVRAAIEKRLSSIQAAGHPLSAQDMAARFPDPPSDRDAYLLLKPAFTLVNAPDIWTNASLSDWLTLPGSAPLERSAIEDGAKWIGINQSAFNAIPWGQNRRRLDRM